MASYGLPGLPGELQVGLKRLHDDAYTEGYQRAIAAVLGILEDVEGPGPDELPPRARRVLERFIARLEP